MGEAVGVLADARDREGGGAAAEGSHATKRCDVLFCGLRTSYTIGGGTRLIMFSMSTVVFRTRSTPSDSRKLRPRCANRESLESGSDARTRSRGSCPETTVGVKSVHARVETPCVVPQKQEGQSHGVLRDFGAEKRTCVLQDGSRQGQEQDPECSSDCFERSRKRGGRARRGITNTDGHSAKGHSQQNLLQLRTL